MRIEKITGALIGVICFYPENYCQVSKNTESFRNFVPEKKSRMDRYRKMYNENFLGTSYVSILKFYYASFRIQQGKGNVSGVGKFLNICTNAATSTSKFANLDMIPHKKE